MATYTYSNSGNFAPTSGTAAYRLDVSVDVVDVSGGWRLDIASSVTMTRNPGTPAFGTGTRGYSVPGGRTTSTSGTLSASASGVSWSYDFGASSTVSVYNFSRYIASSYGSSTTVSISAAGSGSTYLTSKTVSVVASLITPTPAPTQNTAPSISGTGEAGTSLTFSGGTYTNATSVTTKLVASTSASALTNGGGSVISSTSPYTITTNDAAYPAFYFATMDTVNGTGGPYYYYSGTILSYPAIPNYTVSFTNSYGSNGAIADKIVKQNNTTTFPDPGTRAGYTFTGWNNNSNYTSGSTTPAITANTTYTADTGWATLAPGFTDETVTGNLFINQSIESTSNYTVSATNTTSYSLEYAGSGLNPLGWLSINNSGQLSGSTSVPGTYTFRVKATGTATSTNSNTITINVVYPGKRINSTFGQSAFATAKRWDGSQWVALTSMKRWNGSSWVNLSN